ncbi:MAG: primosomal protein N' [Gammaproteobacteria bacterium]|nr:primosomal protein N' [Gammaproteobacteria bacterium]
MTLPLVLQVAVPAPLYTLFDYLPPEGCDSSWLCPGLRVKVPFGSGVRCGFILAVRTISELDPGKLKRVIELVEKEPLLGREDMALLRWAAGYYQYPLGEVMAGALPVRLRKGEKPSFIAGRPGWQLTDSGRKVDPELLTRAPRQAEIIRAMRAAGGALPRDEITAKFGRCRGVLGALGQKGWLESCEIEPGVGNPYPERAPEMPSPPELNDHQRDAVAEISRRHDRFGVFLLDGVTGSGKTEVYIRLVERIVQQGKQVLVLVPEIGLTPQLMGRFQRRIGAPMALLHSSLSEKSRELAWHSARTGEAGVVIGTRSAVFVPLPDLGLILVDEEHDLSFKQQEGFRYSARDLAVVRAQRRDCPVILGSATPSLETFRNALEGRYHHLRLPERAGAAREPRLDLLDIRSSPLEAGISPTLARMVKEQLSEGNQVLMFLNRRGYSPLLTCFECGWTAQCRRCDARMTLHLSSRQLWCHHCGSRRRIDPVCPDCGDPALKPMGQGTERLEESLQKRLPEFDIVRIDRDSTRRRGSLERLLTEIRSGKHSLLLGTQMLAKGHHFPDVTLVGIIDVDHGLYGADYRAAERMAQQIIQVAGRAGRAERPGRVVIQTRHPDHPLLQKLLRQGYAAFARESLLERREAGLPPYSHQVLLRAEAHRADAPSLFLEEAAGLARNRAGAEMALWGPVPAPMERRAGRFRAHLLVQSEKRAELHSLLGWWVPELCRLKSARRVRWSVDVDPQEML